MNLSEVKPPKGQVKVQRRVGRGMGSGRGKYSGRGAKGARSISGYSKMRGFEGGQMPMHRRLPKRGFSNAIFQKNHAIINTGMLEVLEGDTFSPASLKASGIVKKLGDGLKVLAHGDLTRPIHITAHLFSKTAEEKIKAAGGTCTIITPKAPIDTRAKSTRSKDTKSQDTKSKDTKSKK